MPIRCDYHMHTPRCLHALGPLEGYIETGIALGLEEIGFADHCPLPGGMGGPKVRMREAELDDYVTDVLRLRDQYRGQITVRLGLELDYVVDLESYCAAMVARYPWDYIIGSVHYLDPECRMSSWPRNYAGDGHALYARYFELMRGLAASGLCDIIAHFDVVKRSGKLVTDQETESIALTLRAIARANLCVEINTSGYRHTDLRTPAPYPDFPIIEQLLAAGIPLTVNSDAHAPDQVGLKFEDIARWLRGKGCRQLVRFERRKRTAYAL